MALEPRLNPAKQVAIYLGGGRELAGIPLYIQDNVSLNFSSEYAPLLSGNSNALIDYAGQIAGFLGNKLFGAKPTDMAFSSQNKYFGFQQWKGTDPVTFTLTLSLHVGIADKWDAKTEVYDPIMRLIYISLPDENGLGILTPPGGQLINLLVDQAQSTNNGGNTQEAVPGVTASDPAGKALSIRIGNLVFIPRAILVRAEPSWGTDLDKKGYPLSATVTLDFRSAFSATRQLLDHWSSLGASGAYYSGPYNLAQKGLGG